MTESCALRSRLVRYMLCTKINEVNVTLMFGAAYNIHGVGPRPNFSAYPRSGCGQLRNATALTSFGPAVREKRFASVAAKTPVVTFKNVTLEF